MSYNIYIHRNPNTKEVFYVGMSDNEKRPYNFSARNNQWKSIYDEYGCDVEIIWNDLTKEEAIKKEKETIKKYKSDRLTNIYELDKSAVIAFKVSKKEKEFYISESVRLDMGLSDYLRMMLQ